MHMINYIHLHIKFYAYLSTYYYRHAPIKAHLICKMGREDSRQELQPGVEV